MAAVRHLGFYTFAFFCPVAFVSMPFCFLIQNFAEIGQSVDDLWPKKRCCRCIRQASLLIKSPFYRSIRQGAPLNYRYFAQFSLLFKNVPTQSPNFFSGSRQFVSCCQPQNRSVTSLTTLILLVSVGFVQFHSFL